MLSKKHNDLKKIAIKFLQDLGCKYIYEEYHLDSVVVDIYDPIKRIAIECGSTPYYRLRIISKYAVKIYILPHGDVIPYEWNSNIIPCTLCGHKMGNTDYDAILKDLKIVIPKRNNCFDKNLPRIVELTKQGFDPKYIAHQLNIPLSSFKGERNKKLLLELANKEE